MLGKRFWARAAGAPRLSLVIIICLFLWFCRARPASALGRWAVAGRAGRAAAKCLCFSLGGICDDASQLSVPRDGLAPAVLHGPTPQH